MYLVEVNVWIVLFQFSDKSNSFRIWLHVPYIVASTGDVFIILWDIFLFVLFTVQDPDQEVKG